MKAKTFEQAMEELENLVSKMENGSLGLKESIDCYEKSKKLALYCEDLLSSAEQKITTIDFSDS